MAFKMVRPFMILASALFLLVDVTGFAATRSNQVARKHLALGDALYKQGKVDQAVDEWKMALELDALLKKAGQRIAQAEQGDHHVDLEEGGEESIEPMPEATVEAQPDQAVIKVQAQILEVQKMGGKATKIIMAAGAQKGIRPGLSGVVVDGSGVPLAAFTVKIIDPDKSLADVTGSSREIPENAIAVISIPK